MRYAIVAEDGSISSILSAATKDMVVANTPDKSKAIVCEDGSITPDTHNYINNAFVAKITDKAVLETKLLNAVDSMRESFQMTVLTPGGAKKMIYNSKQSELTDYTALGSAVVSALNLAGQRARFPYASTEAAISGETLAQVMARWAGSIAVNMVEVQRVEAIAIVAKRRIKAATTSAAKQAVFDQINWQWKPVS